MAKNYDALIRYNLLWNRDELTLPDFPVSESTYSRRKSRRYLTRAMRRGCGLIVSVVGGSQNRKHKMQFLYGAALLGIFAPVLLGLWMLFDWDSLFYTFHDVVFQNSYWLFDPSTDPVITILPDSFFLHAAILILCGLLIGSVSFLATGCFLHRRFKKQQNK
ncbi:MAG: TIGR01906 family membrane protein [Lachnospiraceae bacterium]